MLDLWRRRWRAADEDTQRRCGVLATTAVVILLLMVAAAITVTRSGLNAVMYFLALDLGIPTLLLVLILALLGRAAPAAAVLSAYIFVALCALAVIEGPSTERLSLVNVAIVALGCVLRTWFTLAFATVFAVLVVGLGAAESLGLAHWTTELSEARHMPFVRQVLTIGLMVLFLRRGYDRLYQRVRRQEVARQSAVDELSALNNSLELVIGERTAGLRAARDRVAALAGEAAAGLEQEVVEIRRRLAEALKLSTAEGERRDDLERAGRAADRLAEMADNLASHARVGRVALQPVVIDLQQLMGEVVEQFRGLPDGGRVHWQLGALPSVWGDRVLIRSVLENLVGNAVKFSRECPQPEVHIGADADGRCYIQDNGVGFDPPLASRLFAPFRRLHRQEQFEGQGMGLANVRSIVERHGGDIRAEGKPGEGARFSFRLPATAAGLIDPEETAS
jgi:signal transduction histidine kinase